LFFFFFCHRVEKVLRSFFVLYGFFGMMI